MVGVEPRSRQCTPLRRAERGLGDGIPHRLYPTGPLRDSIGGYRAGNASGLLVVPGRGCRRLVPVGLRRRCRSRSVVAGRGGSGNGIDEHVLPAYVAVVPGFSCTGFDAARYCWCLHVDDHPFGVAILARPGRRLEGAHFTAVNLNPRCEIGRTWPIMGAGAAAEPRLAANIRRRLK